MFKGVENVAESQIIQEDLEQVRVRLVPAPGYRVEDGRLIVSNLQERMGNIQVVVEIVPSIERAGGKFRAVICRLPRELRPYAGPGSVRPADTAGTLAGAGPGGG